MPGLPKSTENGDGVDHGDRGSPDDMHEGQRLRRLLDAKRYDQKQLGVAAGVSKAAVGKWVKDEKFSDKVWEKICLGLNKLGLNPLDIRPEARAQGHQEDLTRLIETWPRDQLTVVKRILESDLDSRTILLAYINGALRNLP